MEWFVNHLSTLEPAQVYLALGGVLLLCGLGLPVPEDISLIAAGYFAYKGVLKVHPAFLVCFSAVLAGDTLAFLLGHFFGRKALRTRLAHRYFNVKRQRRVRAYFRMFGNRVVFIGRFLPGLRFSIFFSAGMLRVRTAVFVIYDGLAALISVPLLVYLAYFFGENIDHVISYARRTQHGMLLVLAVVGLLLLGRALIRRRRRKATGEREEPEPEDAGLHPDDDPGDGAYAAPQTGPPAAPEPPGDGKSS